MNNEFNQGDGRTKIGSPIIRVFNKAPETKTVRGSDPLKKIESFSFLIDLKLFPLKKKNNVNLYSVRL